eukprot:TRINITY_DN5722_c0_g1_i2.p2 TRINITY_DN5722_c0_g1~~TRINITY_DN5722_c0_g1_i2.p2  ORF type:complete len:238 (-),score=9.49 TRINITY_DN5722_c0_g1_i2:39-752(-)
MQLADYVTDPLDDRNIIKFLLIPSLNILKQKFEDSSRTIAETYCSTKALKNMKKELIRLIKMLSKNAIYGIIIQCIFYSALMADKGKAQSVNDIFISVEMNNATLEEAFSMIQNETQFKFSYAKLKLDKNVRISTKAKVQTLAELLGKISKEAKLKFVRINDNIVVDKRKKFEIFYNDPVIEESNQDVVVSGTITSGEDGQPLPGVSVVVKGTTSGTVTDIDGKYKITAPSNASITY